MFEKKNPSFFFGSWQNTLFLLQRYQRTDVVSHNVRKRDVGRCRYQIAAEKNFCIAVGNQGELLCGCVSVADDHVDAGKQFFLSVNEGQHSAFLKQHEIFFHEASAIFLCRMLRQIPVFALDIMRRIAKRRGGFSVVDFRTPAAMIEVEVCENNVGNIVRGDSMFRKRSFQIVTRVIKAINIFQLLSPFRSVAVVDKNHLAVADKEEAAGSKRDAVAGIGWICLRPKYPGHNAKHCAAVERKAPGLNRMNFITADVHSSESPRWTRNKKGRLFRRMNRPL